MAEKGKRIRYYLKQLGKTDARNFASYLRTELLGNSIPMHDLFLACMEQRDWESLDLKHLHLSLFPQKPWKKKAADYLFLRLSQLQQHLHAFLAFQHFRKDKHSFHQSRLMALTERGWDQYLDSTYRQAKNALPSPSGAKNLLSQLRLEMTLNSHLSTQAVAGTDTHLPELHDALDHYYFLQKLKYATASVNAALLFGDQMEVRMVEVVLATIAKAPDNFPVVIRAYAAAYQMLEHTVRQDQRAASYFQNLQKLLYSAPEIARDEAGDLFTYAINYATLQWHAQVKGSTDLIVGLYDKMLEGQILQDEGGMPPRYYKNIVAMACKLGRLEWAQDFADAYKEKISGNTPELAVCYNQAVLSFHRGDYAGTVRLLYHRIGEFRDELFALGARIYLCRALWEQEEMDWLGRNLIAFRKYLKRTDTLVEVEKKTYLLYVSMMLRLQKAASGNPDLVRQKLQKIGIDLNLAPDTQLLRSLKAIVVLKMGNA